jgi:glycosyltransferase involved in cell wall biosynthesis
VKLLFLTKRQPQQRDLIERPYGRFFHLPAQLSALGHEVHVALVSHRGQADEAHSVDRMSWTSVDARTNGPFAAWRKLGSIAQQFRPDWIVGCSDLYYGIAAVSLAQRCGSCAAIDAYDNFEGYMPWAKPLHWWWHRALAHADLVTAAGPQLAQLLRRHHGREVRVIPMAADPLFVPGDRLAARAQLALPPNAPLIGHCGSFTTSRGSSMVLDAFAIVRDRVPDACLVFTGRYPRDLDGRAGIIGLGMVGDHAMPVVLNSLDVACVLLADTPFGRYSHPAKLYEAMACGVPVVATATEPARWILRDVQDRLARIGDASDLAAKILRQLEQPSRTHSPQPQWSEIAQRFEALLAT